MTFLPLNICNIELNEAGGRFIKRVNLISVLNVGANRLCSLPDEISRMNELRVLDISKNRFSLFPNAVLANSRIEDILAEENEISGLFVLWRSLLMRRSFD
jgi:Leucine-rich repeat (LRR) protein